MLNCLVPTAPHCLSFATANLELLLVPEVTKETH